MEKPRLTFEDLPALIGLLLEKVDRIEEKVNELTLRNPKELEYLNVEQALEFLQIAKSTLYNKVHKKEIPHLKFKGCLRFKKEDLRAYLEEGKVATSEEEKWRIDDIVDGLFQNKRRTKTSKDERF